MGAQTQRLSRHRSNPSTSAGHRVRSSMHHLTLLHWTPTKQRLVKGDCLCCCAGCSCPCCSCYVPYMNTCSCRWLRREHGMITEEHVIRGQVLVQVPSSVMMTWDTARESPLCGAVVKEAELTEWQVSRHRPQHAAPTALAFARLWSCAHAWLACWPRSHCGCQHGGADAARTLIVLRL